MKTFEPRTDSPQDVVTQTGRLCRAIIGQIHRQRAGASREATAFALDAWEKIATKDYVIELAMRAMAGSSAFDVIARLRRDVVMYLNDCARIDRGAANTIGSARELLAGAIDLALRHS